MNAARPDPPRDLGPAGRRAWRAAHAALDADVQFTAKDLELLRLVCGQTDTVAALESGEADHKLLGPARACCAKLWTEIRVEVDASEGLAPPVTSRRAQRAAQARWRARANVQKELAKLGGA